MTGMVIQSYDFDQFRKRFVAMSDKDLITEYANVCNRIKEVEDLYESGKCSFDDLGSFLEDAAMVRDYVGCYLAGLYIQDHGYIYTSGDRWFPCGT